MNFIRCNALLSVVLLLMACSSNENKPTTHRKVTDALGRTVPVPDSIEKIIAIRPSALRLISFAGGAAKVCGVEEGEADKSEFTHICAYPSLSKKPVIGPRMGGDAELILTEKPDVIFMATTTIGAANELQKKIGIPVVCIEYGDLGKKRQTFYNSLKIVGDVLHTTAHTDSLIHYIEDQISELDRRTVNLTSPPVYVGAIAYKGERDLTATDPYYPAFTFLHLHNVASEIDSTLISAITGTFINPEKILEWNPDYIFVDRGSAINADRDFKKKTGIYQLLKAYKNDNIYMVWPYNNYHSNIEAMLLNAWYIGKCIYPEAFADIDIEEKGNEVFTAFYGVPLYDKMQSNWGHYQRLEYNKGGQLNL